MPRGQPDYGLYTETPVASGISDPGEAAARLGSINVYDRRGWTIWMDDFEAPDLRWTPSSTAGAVDPVLSTTKAWMGVQSVYFVTPAVAFEGAELTKFFPLLRLGKVGSEFFILLFNGVGGSFGYVLDIFDGTNHSYGQLALDFAAKTASIYTSGAWEIIATNCFNDLDHNTWVPIKLVVNMDTDYYDRLLVGPNEFDISAHPLVLVGADNDRLLRSVFGLVASGAAINTAYLDNFILTQTEP